jgi:hypothetical protein
LATQQQPAGARATAASSAQRGAAMLASPRDVVVTSRSRGGGARGDACAPPSPSLRACLATLAAATAAHAHAHTHAHAAHRAAPAAAEGTNKGPPLTAAAAAARPLAAAAPPSVIDLTRDTDDDDAVVNSGAARAAPAAPAAATSEVVDLTAWALDAAAEDAAARDIVAAERRGIAAFLASPAGAGLRVVAVAANPHAAPGCALYKRFARARALCADASVALVFHGTPSANVGSICARGLDPARRQRMALGPGDYFGRTAAVSLAYCGGAEAVAESGGGGGGGGRGGGERRTRQLIVFALLTDVSGVTAATHSVLVVHATAHQLVRARACVRVVRCCVRRIRAHSHAHASRVRALCVCCSRCLW